MRQHRMRPPLLCAVTLVLALAGCKEKMSAPRLMEAMLTATERTPATQLTIDMELDAALRVHGLLLEFDGELVSHTILSPQSGEAHLDTELSLSLSEEEFRQAMQLYVQKEGNELVPYLHLQPDSRWIRSTGHPVGQSSSGSDALRDRLLAKAPEELTLSEEMAKVHGTSSYILTCPLTWEDIQASVGTEGLADALKQAGLDISSLSSFRWAATYYVDFHSHLPLKIELNGSASEPLPVQLPSISSQLSSGAPVAGELVVESFRITLDRIGREPVSLPPLPAAAAGASGWEELTPSFPVEPPQTTQSPVPSDSPEETPSIEIPDEPPKPVDLGSGPFSMEHGAVRLTATLPEDWFATEVHPDILYLAHRAQGASGDFSLYTTQEASYQSLRVDLEDSLYYWLTTEEYHSHGELALADWYTFWVRFDDGSVHYHGLRALGQQGSLSFSLYDAEGGLAPKEVSRLLSDSMSP